MHGTACLLRTAVHCAVCIHQPHISYLAQFFKHCITQCPAAAAASAADPDDDDDGRDIEVKFDGQSFEDNDNVK